MTAAKVLVVEDNATLALGLRNNLKLEGYEVEVAADGELGLATARSWQPDAVVLDLMLPKMDGYRVLRAMREEGIEVPVLILTALGDEADKVRGFRAGADQYLTKPFSVMELLSRVEALVRRSRSRRERGASDQVITFGDVRVDPDANLVFRGEDPVSLTPKAFDLLLALVRRAGAVATRQDLMREVWAYEETVVSRTIDAHVAELRRKLEPNPSSPRHILTVWKRGYRFQA